MIAEMRTAAGFAAVVRKLALVNPNVVTTLRAGGHAKAYAAADKVGGAWYRYRYMHNGAHRSHPLRR